MAAASFDDDVEVSENRCPSSSPSKRSSIVAHEPAEQVTGPKELCNLPGVRVRGVSIATLSSPSAMFGICALPSLGEFSSTAGCLSVVLFEPSICASIVL